MAMFLKKDELPDKMIYKVGAPLEFNASQSPRDLSVELP